MNSHDENLSEFAYWLENFKWFLELAIEDEEVATWVAEAMT